MGMSLSAHAANVFVEPLYWQADEEIDWAYTNNLNASNQQVAYQTSTYDTAPGIRLGFGLDGKYENEFYFTHFKTDTNESATGNLVSGFLGATAGKPSNDFTYDAGQFDADIDYNMLEWDLGKSFNVNSFLTIKPVIGLAGGTINQDMEGDFQGSIDSVEKIKNDFTGIGPKAGVKAIVTLLNKKQTKVNFDATFTSYYLWGNWDLSDKYTDNTGRAINVDLDDKDMGSLGLQAIVGFELEHKQLSATLGYEMNTWFNQLQIFDDATGSHDNNLVLQGWGLKIAYNFDF